MSDKKITVELVHDKSGKVQKHPFDVAESMLKTSARMKAKGVKNMFSLPEKSKYQFVAGKLSEAKATTSNK